MKLRLHDLVDAEAMRQITAAVLRADLGSRINFEYGTRTVRIESRLTADETVSVIARSGHAVAVIVDASNDALGSLPAR